MTPGTRYVLRMAAANVAAAVFVAVAFFGAGTRAGWDRTGESLAIGLLFSACIGTPCAIVLPRVAPVFWRGFGFPLNWTALVVTMFVLAMAGSAAAIAILVAAGYVPAAAFGTWFARAIGYAVITTLTFGIAISAYEMMRARLDEATLALRTRERDEAEARRLAAEAHLASLESRVQPHFLFNTLNSIASLIQTNPSSAERMTGQLASLLRASLDYDGALVPVEHELKAVRDYLDIEQVRFGERLRYTVDVEDAVRDAMVPRLSIQTVVENAVKYAVSPRREGGSVAVRAKVDAGRIGLEVEDDGPGFEVAGIPDNHGLALVRSRLALMYGDRAELAVDSRPGRTIVSMRIPREPRI